MAAHPTATMGTCQLSRSTIYQRVSDGTFPKQISLGARAVGWIEQSITDWIEQQIAASRKVAS